MSKHTRITDTVANRITQIAERIDACVSIEVIKRERCFSLPSSHCASGEMRADRSSSSRVICSIYDHPTNELEVTEIETQTLDEAIEQIETYAKNKLGENE